MNLGDQFGGHRVLEPKGVLPKAALRLDNTTPPLDNEIGIRVEMLHITSTSFNNLWRKSGKDENRFKSILKDIVDRRGKFQDPVTGSGGVLLGSVDFVGSTLKVDLQPGDQIVTMISLALTPLRIERIGNINPELGQVQIDGYAILFKSGLWAKLPEDIPSALAIMVLDVAGAPAYAARYIHAGQRVLVVGGGKAGLLCLHEAKKRVGVTGQVLLVEKEEERAKTALLLGLVDNVIIADATQSLDIYHRVEHLTEGALADVSFNFANLPNTEMATILSTRDDGKIIFYSMATDFGCAALGAEGAGKTVIMIIGNGYIPGHARIALQALRENERLREYFSGLDSHS